MKVVPATDIAVESPLRVARRVFLRHARRKNPDTRHCSLCGGLWLAKGFEGRLVDGCAARQYAAGPLAEAGQLDQDGHLISVLRGGAEQNGS